MPNSVTSIGDNAFAYCSGLTSITIPASVESIGVRPFGTCSKLTNIRVDSGNKVYDSRGDCNAIIETATNTLLQGCNTTYIPNTVTSIGDGAFMDCYDITSITIPNSVISIGTCAFDGCSGLTSLTIPNSVISIGNSAFYFCSGLTSLTIPASVESIGGGAFCLCYNLTNIRVVSGNKVYDSREDCNAIIETATNKLLQGCSTTYIPNTVTSIDNQAFFECNGLESITIPHSVTSIGVQAFQGTGLMILSIPNSVTDISPMAFSRCSRLISITIPNSVRYIGREAFSFCSFLMNITIPNSVTDIGFEAFCGCSSLRFLDIGSSVSTIEKGTFSRCSGLEMITSFNTTPPRLEEDNFTDEQYANVLLYVPWESIGAYEAADGWKNFFHIQGTKVSGIESAEADSENQPAAIFDLQGRKLSSPQKGINIVGGKKVLMK